MSTRSQHSVLRRFVGVTTDPQTYRNLAYLALAFPLGILYFSAIVTGVSIGVGTLPILVGVPILVAVVVFAVVLGDVESRLAAQLLRIDVNRTTVPRPDGEPLFSYLGDLMLDPRSYLAVLYLLSKLFVGVAAFITLVTLASLSAAVTAAPLLYSQPDVHYQIWPSLVVDTLPEALALSVGGVLLALVSLHACNLLATVLGRYTQAFLGTGENWAPNPGEWR